MGGVEAGIEGGIHGMHLLWLQHYQEEDWGFLLIDAQNDFDEETQTAMIWEVWYEWSISVHWATLVVRNSEGSGHFLHRKEEMNQGDPVSMIDYGIGVPPLIRELRDAHPCVTQPCYAGDTGEGGSFGNILAHLQDLHGMGAPRGYLLEPRKSILVVSLQIVARAEAFFQGMGLKVVNRSQYLGGLIGEQGAESMCLEKKVEGWAVLVQNLLGVDRQHPHTVYAGMQKSLQKE